MNYPRLLLTAATVACLLPWVNRAFFVDDPLFLWSAERILADPRDFYGGDVIWGPTTTRLVDEFQNPPLQSYYLAAVARYSGFREIPLHLAMLLPTLAAVLGTYSLARRLSELPLLAGAILLTSPGFLLSSTTLMCDVPMLALWIWAIVLWSRGIDERQDWTLAAASLLMGACGLTKYFGIALVPLALAYGLTRRRALGGWCLWLLVPLAMFAAFEWYCHVQYGRQLIWGATTFATGATSRQGLAAINRGFLALVYAGAGLLPLAVWMPWLWSWRGNLAWILAALGLGWWLAFEGGIGPHRLRTQHGIDWNLLIHFTLFATLGAQALALAVADGRRSKDATALLLSLWVVGTLVFAAWFNWTISGRTLLPVIPAVGILVARRIGARSSSEVEGRALRWSWSIPLVLGLAGSQVLCWADYGAAAADRTAALSQAEKFGKNRGTSTLWFEGHWGFQYYLEREGARPIDFHSSMVLPGDVVLVQGENPALNVILDRWLKTEMLEGDISDCLTTSSRGAKASFYSHIMGPLPYRVGEVSPRTYQIYIVLEATRFEKNTPKE